jgi:hypothetical protein
MASVNKVILVGNLGVDPEIRRTASGDAVCTLSLATTEKYKDKSGAQQPSMNRWLDAQKHAFWRGLFIHSPDETWIRCTGKVGNVKKNQVVPICQPVFDSLALVFRHWYGVRPEQVDVPKLLVLKHQVHGVKEA